MAFNPKEIRVMAYADPALQGSRIWDYQNSAGDDIAVANFFLDFFSDPVRTPHTGIGGAFSVGSHNDRVYDVYNGLEYKLVFDNAQNPTSVTVILLNGTPTPPPIAPGTATLVIVSGNNQTAEINTVLPDLVVVQLLDAENNPIPDVDIAWVGQPNSGTVDPPISTTGADGQASTQWTLGDLVGQQTLIAEADMAGVNSVTFSATAQAVTPEPASVNIVSGNNQTGTVNTVLAQPLVVEVVDENNTPLEGIEVNWSAVSGGSVDPQIVMTGPNGQASTNWTLGGVVGQQSATATVGSLPPATFDATAEAAGAVPTAINIVSGNNQTADINTALANPLVVEVVDIDGNPVQGVVVNWGTTSGTVNPEQSPPTGADGQASTQWTLGGTVGEVSASASIDNMDVDPAAFTATATPGTQPTPDSLTISGGNNQTGTVSQVLPTELQVTVQSGTDPVAGVEVTWTVTLGTGSVIPVTSTTNAQGIATTEWTLGPEEGAQTVDASVTGLPNVTFTATAEPAVEPEPEPPLGPVFYVRNGGDDTADGLTHATAWATIDKVNQTTFQPGDSVLFHEGDTFTFPGTTPLNIDWIGSESQYVMIGSYFLDGGVETRGFQTARPVLDRENQPTTPNRNISMVNIIGPNYVRLENLELVNSNGRCIFIDNGDNCQVVNCRIDNIAGSGIGCVAVDNGLISGNVISDTENLYLTQPNTWAAAIAFQSQSQNPIIRNNIIDRTFGEGINCFDGTANALIEHNTVFAARAVGIYLDAAPNTIVRRNILIGTTDTDYWRTSNSVGQGIVVNNEPQHYEGTTPLPINIQSRNCQIYDNLVAFCSAGFGFWGELPQSTFDNTRVYNNTFIDSRVQLLSSDGRPMPGSLIRNNIFLSITAEALDFRPTDSFSGVTASNNYWSQGAPTIAELTDPSDVLTGIQLVRMTEWRTFSMLSEVDPENFRSLDGSTTNGAGFTLEGDFALDFNDEPHNNPFDLGGLRFGPVTPPAAINIIAGNNQTGTINSPLPLPLVVQVLDADTNPLGGVEVTWATENGSVDPVTVITGSDGEAETVWTLGGFEGAQEATATVQGLPSATFNATGTTTIDPSTVGFVNVMDFGADNSGSDVSAEDNVTAIRDAVAAAYDLPVDPNTEPTNLRAVFFPPGEYAINNLISLQRLEDFDVVNNKRFRPGHVLVGSTSGAQRPTIRLVDGSPGYDDPSRPTTGETPETRTTLKAMFEFWTWRTSDPEDHEFNNAGTQWNSGIRGINLVTGANPGAVALRHLGAEGTFTQDVNINATGGFCGIYQLIGSGGSTTNVGITGGQYGVYAQEARAAPVIAGMTCSGQTQAAVLYGGTGALTLVGCVFDKPDGPLIELPERSDPGNGNLSMVDCMMELTAPSPVTATVVNNNRMVYMKNCYSMGSGNIVANTTAASEDLTADPAVWTRVDEYALSMTSMTPGFSDQTKMIDDVKNNNTVSNTTANQVPPADLQSRHVWATNDWSFEDADVELVQPGGLTDHTTLIQNAINSSERVFLAKGIYTISAPLQMTANTKLFGVAGHLSIIQIHPSDWNPLDQPGTNVSMLTTPDSVATTARLAFLGFWLENRRLINGINWQLGEGSIVNTVWIANNTLGPAVVNARQRVVIQGSGGGRWYNHRAEGGNGNNHVDNRGMQILNTTESLSFYMLHNQHIQGMTLSEMTNCQNIRIYSGKSETNVTPTQLGPGIPRVSVITDSQNIEWYTLSGISQVDGGKGLIEINNSTAILVANAIRMLILQTPVVDPTTWYHVMVTPSTNTGINGATPANLVKIS